MRVTDYIADRLYKEGAKDVFMVSGGGMMFLSDGLAQHPHINVICNHHEQASAMAAVGYAKYTENIGVAYVSTGCGATNAITGLLHAWQDNTSCIFISGQVKQKETVRGTQVPIRQIGTQEADIIAIVEPVAKYAVMVTDPKEVPYHLEKALYLAKSGRPGPVWIDVPMDVQGAPLDLSTCKMFSPKESKASYKTVPTQKELSIFCKMLKEAKRPVIIAGQGIRLAKAIPEFTEFIEKHNIPVVAPYMGVAMIPTDHPLYVGVIGTKGSRAGNLAMQNADLIISMGSRLHVTAIGYEYEQFAREAKKIVIDIDTTEHSKKTITIDQLINADMRAFLTSVTKVSLHKDVPEWITLCQKWKKKYPVCLPEYALHKKGISLYHFVDVLSRTMKPDSVVVSDAGSAFYVTTQAINIKKGQRYITSGGQAEMGFTLPGAIGACIARGNKDVIGITGDGSFQMNIQELQTIFHHQMPVKLFVWNNNGYLSIKTTQRKFFEGRLIGAHPASGVSVPDTKKIAAAYDIPFVRLSKSATLKDDIKKVLAMKGPVLCEVVCLEDDMVIPTVSSLRKEDGTMVSKPLEDMFPFLDREEFFSNMIVKPIEE